MTILVAYRKRGSRVYTHHFHVHASQWRRFLAQARLFRSLGEYAVVRHGQYTPVLG